MLCIPFLFLFKALAQSEGAGLGCVVTSKLKYPKYTLLKLSGKKKGSQVEVEDLDGKLSWVQRKDISINRKCVVVKTAKSQLRLGPGKEFGSVGIVEKGAAFLDLGGEDGWTRVQNFKGEKAWVNLDHLWLPVGKKMRMSFEDQ